MKEHQNDSATEVVHDPSCEAMSTQVILDENDKAILQILQDDFPVVEEPWLEISNILNISQTEVLSRLKRLVNEGAILRIGPILDRSTIGLKAATLVAMRVPKDKVKDVANAINKYNVSHNYERDHEYNIWFTLSAPTNKELAVTLEEIKQKTGVKEHDILDLPTVQRFKINVRFQLTKTSL